MIEYREPFDRFSVWLEEATGRQEIAEPTAMCLSTMGKDNIPNSRMVLLKEHGADGFVFYTNDYSQKGEELAAHPFVALCFYWMPLARQVRLRGQVSKVSNEQANDYFASRRRGSQIGAWASHQSEPLGDREELVLRLQEYEKKFEGKEVPRPPHWNGWCLRPDSFEFWQEGEYRLHQRELYQRDGEGWKKLLLNP